MSTLAWTAQLVRISPRPFGDVEKDVPVFAQLLVGGSGVLVIDRLRPPAGRVRLQVDAEHSELDLLRAGLAIVEPELAPQSLADLMARHQVLDGETVALTSEEVTRLSAVVQELRVSVHVTEFQGRFKLTESELCQWELTVVPSAG